MIFHGRKWPKFARCRRIFFKSPHFYDKFQ
jgi:hypothetical protein